MPTVQQPRRGATRRVLKAAGLALGAVLVSSQAQGAYAADGAATALSTCPGVNDQVNSEPNGDGLCECKPGYSNRQAFVADDPIPGLPQLDCRYCTPGYYLKTASGGVGSVCAQIDQTKLHSTTVNAADIGANVVTSALAQAPTSANDGDFCAAGHYGTATSFDGTGCTACPFGGSSDAGSRAVTDCDPDCSETNADSGAVADGFGTCQCAANYYGSFPVDATGGTSAAASAGCTACPAGGTSTAGTASSSGCTAPPPTTADSAGATTPIAVALATAAAVPLLL
jgi:hypothetical protein